MSEYSGLTDISGKIDGQPRPGRTEYEPELPDDDYIGWLKLQQKNTTDELTKAAYWAAEHTYRVLVRCQQPHFIEDPA